MTIDGRWSDDSPSWPYFNLYEGTNSGNTEEDAVVVIDSATDVEVRIFHSTGTIYGRGTTPIFTAAFRPLGRVALYLTQDIWTLNSFVGAA